MNKKILVIGASGQIGTELTLGLREKYGSESVIASDIRKGNEELIQGGIFQYLDVTDREAIEIVLKKYQIEDVYLMAAMLSVTAEKFPQKAWNLNINSLLYILDFAKEGLIKKVFWPSSIAVFGSTTPKVKTPQTTIMEPETVYGISKQAGERWCAYYKHKYNVDVRTIRYPGIISWKTNPGGGTTDYAIEIFHKAITNKHYDCFLEKNTELPMMYMDDAVKATIEIMSTPVALDYYPYNIAAISFTPEEISKAIQEKLPDFTISYQPDFRQEIADSWPKSIDDSKARTDWNWQHTFDLEKITKKMLNNLSDSYKNV